MAAFIGRSALRSSLQRVSRPRIPLSRRIHSGDAAHLSPPPHAARRLTGAVLLGVPLVGGSLLYLYPTEPSVVPTLLANPAVIPCNDSDNCPRTRSMGTHQMSSPNEERRSIIRRVLDLLRDRVWEPIRTGIRFFHLLAIFTPVILTSPMLFVGAPTKKRGERWGAIWWYGFFTAQMQRAGPTFIKLAQWAGSRQDLFPAKFCETLGALHSSARPHSFRHTKRVIEDAFKRPFDQVFLEFSHEPIGTGAIAQVYRAVLNPELLPMAYLQAKKSGRKSQRALDAIADAPRALADYSNPNDARPPIVPTSAVAIKILHPHVHTMIRRDLAIMSFFASCLSIFPGIEWLSLSDEIAVFGGMMNEQLDLRIEARNLRTFEGNFEGRRSAVSFPRPLEDFSNRDVLVEEFQEAVPLKAFLKNGGGAFDHRLANLGLDAFLNMLLLDNFVHSDLHPGNIMVKFYKPTTRYVYQNIFASLFHTTPPPSDPASSTSSPTPTSSHPAITSSLTYTEIATLPPNLQSDAIVTKLNALTHSPDEFLSEIDTIASEGYQPSLVFLDAGLTTVLNSTNRRNFLDLFRAIANFDGYLAGQLMCARCRTPDLVLDKETFALKMQHLVLGVKRKTFSLAQIRISDILAQVLINVRTHHVRMEGDFVNTVLAVLLLEGIGRQLDPSMDLFKSSLPILRQLGGQMSAREAMDEIGARKGTTEDGEESQQGGGNLANWAAMLKIWVWIEARELVSGAVGSIDEMIRHDWLSPNV